MNDLQSAPSEVSDHAATDPTPTGDFKAFARTAPPRPNTFDVVVPHNKKAPFPGLFYGRYWARTSDPQLVELAVLR